LAELLVKILPIAFFNFTRSLSFNFSTCASTLFCAGVLAFAASLLTGGEPLGPILAASIA
jgi:hypothetical protein